MEDTIITAKRKKTELIMLLFCFLLANAGNLYAIITYHTSFIELLTSLGYVHRIICELDLYTFMLLECEVLDKETFQLIII